MQHSSAKRQTGVTLIELMFALAIIGILLAFASSSVSAAMNAARTSSGFSSLLAALTRARSAAANSEVDVVLCPSADGTSCAAGDHWENGWIAFQATHSGSDRDADETILLRQEGKRSAWASVQSSQSRCTLACGSDEEWRWRRARRRSDGRRTCRRGGVAV